MPQYKKSDDLANDLANIEALKEVMFKLASSALGPEAWNGSNQGEIEVACIARQPHAASAYANLIRAQATLVMAGHKPKQ